MQINILLQLNYFTTRFVLEKTITFIDIVKYCVRPMSASEQQYKAVVTTDLKWRLAPKIIHLSKNLRNPSKTYLKMPWRVSLILLKSGEDEGSCFSNFQISRGNVDS